MNGHLEVRIEVFPGWVRRIELERKLWGLRQEPVFRLLWQSTSISRASRVNTYLELFVALLDLRDT
jgi:hypothetical protein